MTDNVPPPSTARLLDQRKFLNAAAAASLNRVVFLAGPYIQTNKSPRKNAKNKAAILRHHLYHKLYDEGWLVTLGEYEKLIEAAGPLLGDFNNAAIAEIEHARSIDTDAIVMLPSSPGSFLELGAFSNFDDICQKMILIVDAQYREHRNYMNSGPVKAAMDRHSKIHFIDYEDHEKCWEAVSQFVSRRASHRAARGILQP